MGTDGQEVSRENRACPYMDMTCREMDRACREMDRTCPEMDWTCPENERYCTYQGPLICFYFGCSTWHCELSWIDNCTSLLIAILIPIINQIYEKMICATNAFSASVRTTRRLFF